MAKIGEWCFVSSTPTRERTSSWGSLELMNGARLTASGLALSGGGWARVRGYTGAALREKTLVVWVRLDSLDEARPGGSAMTVDAQEGHAFDGIVFGEREDRTWVAGSDFFVRTQDLGAVAAETRAGMTLRMTATYAADVDGTSARVSLYRGDELLGSYTRGTLAEWPANDVEVIFGARHVWRGVVRGALTATILGAQLHDRALSRDQIVALACPVQCLTFKDYEPNVPIDTTLPPSYHPFKDDWCCHDAEGRRYWLEKRGNAWVLRTDSSGKPAEYGVPGTQHARIEINDRPARPAHPPAVLLFEDQRSSLAGKLRVMLPTRDPTTGKLTLVTPIPVTSDSMLTAIHSGGGNSVLSIDDDLVLVAYPSMVPPVGGVGTDQYVAVVSRSAQQVVHTQLVGNSTGGTKPDEHDVPVITADARGRLHIVLGGHHTALRWRSIAIDDIRSGSWDKMSDLQTIGPAPGEPHWGHTYVALVCDSQDRLHVVTRWSGDRYRFKLVYNRRDADGTWAPQQSLVDPGRVYYMCWYHRLLLEGERLVLVSPGPLWGQVLPSELSAYRRRWPGELPDDAPGYRAYPETAYITQGRHPGFTLVSEDGGETWASRLSASSPTLTFLAGTHGLDDVRDALQIAANNGFAGVSLDSLGPAGGGERLSARYRIDGAEQSVELVGSGYFAFFGPSPPPGRVVVIEAATYASTDPRWPYTADVKARVEQLASEMHAQFRVRDHILAVTGVSRNVPKQLTVTYRLDGGTSQTRIVAEHGWFVF